MVGSGTRNRLYQQSGFVRAQGSSIKVNSGGCHLVIFGGLLMRKNMLTLPWEMEEISFMSMKRKNGNFHCISLRASGERSDKID